MKKIYLLFLALLFTLPNYAQFVAAYGRNNANQPTLVGTVANATAIGLTRSAGIEISNGTGNFASKGWTTATTRDVAQYIQWSLTITPGNEAILNTVDFSLIRKNQGPTQAQLYYSTNGFTTSTLVTPTIALTNTNQVDLILPLPVVLASSQTVTFRLYGYAAGNTNGVLEVAVIPPGTTEFGVVQPGIKIRGSVTPVDLIYENNVWTPAAPSATTFLSDAYILDGTYTIPSTISLQSLNVSSLGNVVIPTGVLAIVTNTFFESTSLSYPSLISDGTLTGIIEYDRHVNIGAAPGSTTGSNDLIAPPLSGQTFGAFAAANPNIVSDPNNSQRKLFGPFDKATGTYAIYNTSTDGGTTLTSGVGYRAASVDNGSFVFRGAVNSGNVSVPILNSGPQFKEWNLVGNPYPSYIKLAEFLSANNAQFNTNASGVYGYDGAAQDGWTIWNQAYSDANPNAAITPGQGFLVASKAGGGTVNFTPIMRTVGNTDDFIAGRSNGNISLLKLIATSDEANYFTDIYFSDNATLGLDAGYDSAVFGYNAPAFSIYSHLVQDNTGKDMAIQTLPNSGLTSDVTIPLGINVLAGRQVTISIAEMTIPSNLDVYLEDNVTNTFTLLNTSDYTFTATSNLTDTGRFFIHTTNATLSTPSEALNGLQIYASNTTKTLFVKGLITNSTSLRIYDIQGRLMTTNQLAANTNSNEVNLSNLSSGIYVVELKSNSLIRTQKVILK